MQIAILITCHNRCTKTLACIKSIFATEKPYELNFQVFLVDDGSSDGTSDAIKNNYPQVNVIQGSGSLFWAGGMRLAWSEALKSNFDGYLLLNDDTILFPSIFNELLAAHFYSISEHLQPGIYIGSTKDSKSNEYTYGGHRITNNLSGKSVVVKPDNETIQSCDFANANILFVTRNVVESIGILSSKYTHSLADYDYTLRVKKQGFPLLICTRYCGTCEIDHGPNWLSNDFSLSERIKYLRNPKHLAYHEYLYFIKYHYPFYWPMAFLKLWAKTLFPSIWDKYKLTSYGS